MFVLFACDNGDISLITPSAVDEDEDNYTVDEDCDDHDASIFPGAPEVPDDGIDQDCNGLDAFTLFGHRQDTETTVIAPGFVIGNAIEVHNALRVTHLGFTARSPAENARLALYESDGGFPARLHASTDVFEVVQGVNELPLDVPIDIEPGTWWLQISASEYTEIAAGPSELVAYRELSWDAPFSDPYGIPTEYDGPRISLFLMGELP
jgi:hypothetical protein